MNAPAPALGSSAVAAILATPTPAPAVVGHVVNYAAPRAFFTPDRLRDVVERRMIADLGAAAYTYTVDKAGTRTASMVFRDALPDVVSPVAALGRAVKVAIETHPAAPGKKAMPSTRWVFARQAENGSRWIYTSADVTVDHARIEGFHGAECYADGRLVVDAGIPPHVAAALVDAYAAARGVVEPSKINSAVAGYLRAAGGQPTMPGAFLMPDVTPTTRAVLAALVDLGGLAGCYALGAADVAGHVGPVARSLEDDVADVVAASRALIEKARAAAAPDGPTLQTRTGDTAHAAFDDVRSRLKLWRDRLGLALADVDGTLSDAESALDVELDRALAAVAARKAARASAAAAKQ